MSLSTIAIEAPHTVTHDDFVSGAREIVFQITEDSMIANERRSLLIGTLNSGITVSIRTLPTMLVSIALNGTILGTFAGTGVAPTDTAYDLLMTSRESYTLSYISTTTVAADVAFLTLRGTKQQTFNTFFDDADANNIAPVGVIFDRDAITGQTCHTFNNFTISKSTPVPLLQCRDAKSAGDIVITTSDSSVMTTPITINVSAGDNPVFNLVPLRDGTFTGKIVIDSLTAATGSPVNLGSTTRFLR